jgi:hypothetical protein
MNCGETASAFKHVTEALLVDYHTGRAVLYFTAQAADTYSYGPRTAGVAFSPYLVHNCFIGDGLVLVLYKQCQEFVFDRSEFDQAVIDSHFLVHEVDFQSCPDGVVMSAGERYRLCPA